MIAQVIIDGIDIYSTYGVYVTDGGLCGLLSAPALKEPDKIDYPDENGIHVDLSSPALASRTFTIMFASSDNVDDFISVIKSSSKRTWSFPLLGIEKVFRIVSFPEFDFNLFPVFNIELSDDSGEFGIEYGSLEYFVTENQNCSINGVDLSYYGIELLDGCRNEILKPFPIKPNLITQSNYLSGQNYDDDNVVYEPKEVKLSLMISQWNVSRLMTNYKGFLYDLTKSGTRNLVYNGREYECYYKQSTVTRTSFSNIVSYFFDLNLVFINEL